MQIDNEVSKTEKHDACERKRARRTGNALRLGITQLNCTITIERAFLYGMVSPPEKLGALLSIEHTCTLELHNLSSVSTELRTTRIRLGETQHTMRFVRCLAVTIRVS